MFRNLSWWFCHRIRQNSSNKRSSKCKHKCLTGLCVCQWFWLCNSKQLLHLVAFVANSASKCIINNMQQVPISLGNATLRNDTEIAHIISLTLQDNANLPFGVLVSFYPNKPWCPFSLRSSTTSHMASYTIFTYMVSRLNLPFLIFFWKFTVDRSPEVNC